MILAVKARESHLWENYPLNNKMDGIRVKKIYQKLISPRVSSFRYE